MSKTLKIVGLGGSLADNSKSRAALQTASGWRGERRRATVHFAAPLVSEFGSRDSRSRLPQWALRVTLPALSLRGLRDRLDELTGRLVLADGDVGLGNDADEPAVLDNG